MTAPDKIWAYTYDIEREYGYWAYCLHTWQETNPLPIFAVEYTRTAIIPAPGSDYVVGLESALKFCSAADETQSGQIRCAANAALSVRPTDTRVVTIGQLERLVNALSELDGHTDIDDEIRNSVMAEIRTILGVQANE